MEAARLTGPIGNPRGVGFGILMAIITLGIYSFYWSYVTFEELKLHRNGKGIGGAIALILMFVGGAVAIPFLAGAEVGEMYAEDGHEKPVSGLTGLWILIPLVGAIIWFVKLQRALNRYWHAKGASSAEAVQAPVTG